ncbi:baseplate J/gp47 family protein [Paraburkholderia bryophila]|uniref:Putative phage protein gp47/JayE n=1 Tax=Paraburkholderia bryophila TaxID=420952 RepID=A0A7Z0B5S4_9BURK|nr:baseplate J/gp47 family protein [Paraburkholderia bryophila]NYH21378.1 putative phage protein gp47/JayE [Paraburkholderia bryophila]
MPFARPTLTQLRAQVAADIQASPNGSDPLLRFSALKVLGTALAGLANLQYGYTDWVSLQSNPFTATEEFLEAWAALKGIYREAATQAGSVTPGQVTFPASSSTASIPIGSPLTRGDGVAFTTTSLGVVVGNSVTVNAVANADPTGLTGAFGNCAVGTVMNLGTAIAGISSTGSVTTAFTGGADVEIDASLRPRMLFAYQNPPQGGAVKDYITWASEVNGVTRAWCNANGFGAGTVVVYTMFDVTEALNGGFPQGVNGVATLETRGTPTATLDLLTVANWIYPLRPATALVWSVAPMQQVVNFTISGTASFSAATKAAIQSAISGIFVLYGSPLSTTAGQNGTIYLSYIESAIAAISGTQGFVIAAPTGNIVGTTGQLPVLGTITWNP